jgi:hypothetical protein
MHRYYADGDDNDYITCPTCERVFTEVHKYRVPGIDDGEDSLDGESMDAPESNSERGGSQSKRRKFGKNIGVGSLGRDMLGFEPSVKDSSWVRKTDDPTFPLAPSAKTAALKAVLLKGFQEAPDDKVCSFFLFVVKFSVRHLNDSESPTSF